jgi:hypothetical protein
MTGDAADQVREAEARHRMGDSVTAVHLLEEALAASVAVHPELPGWLCGRLAALYRTLGRYDDEVRLLERYRESQTAEEARTRYDARLCKARTIAERKRPRESGALASVRASIGRPRGRRAVTPPPDERIDVALSPAARTTLVEALAADDERREPLMTGVLAALSAEARTRRAPVEELVRTLKSATADAALEQLPESERSARYGAALIQLLALYFEEDAA